MLAYLMRQEIEHRDEEKKADFKDTLFAHSLVNQNPELFFKMYPEDFGLSPQEEMGLDWEVPEDDADVQRMMDELRSTGYGQ